MNDLRLTGLHKRFGSDRVLAGFDLAVPAGSLTALLGPSGAGKTTLLRLLAGFERPDAGTVTIGGRLVAGSGVWVAPDKRRIGYVPQEGSLFPHLTVAANIGFGLPRRERRASARELLELVGLTKLGARYPHELSGGQQQRVAVARALAVRPEVVLLDEPFAALDEGLREELRSEVRRILRQTGTTTLLVTHSQDEALSIADNVAVMRDGQLVQHAPPRVLYTDPADERLACFLGRTNLLAGACRPDGAVVTALGPMPARAAGGCAPAEIAVTALIRPDQIRLTSVDAGDGPTGRVLDCRFHGHDTVIEVRLDDADGQLVLVRALGPVPHGPGDRCRLTATGSALVWPRSVDGTSGDPATDATRCEQRCAVRDEP